MCDLAKTLNMTSVGDLSSAPHFKADEAREKQKEGKTVFYSLADGHIKTIKSGNGTYTRVIKEKPAGRESRQTGESRRTGKS